MTCRKFMRRNLKSRRAAKGFSNFYTDFYSTCSSPNLEELMEHGSHQDQSQGTFSLSDEDYTLSNSLTFTLNQDPRVTFCGHSIPHPSEARVNIRVQTTGDPAREVLKDSCQDLMLICQHVRSTFDQAVIEFKNKNSLDAMKIGP